MTLSTPGIACSMDGCSFKNRVAWTAALNARHVIRGQREDLSLVPGHKLSFRHEVAELMAGEQACRASQFFSMRETDTTKELSVQIPEEAREATDDLLAPFLSGASLGPTSRCCGGCPSTQSNAMQETAQDPSSGQGQAERKGEVAAMATVALACGVCCAVPIALPGVALGSIASALAWLGSAQVAVVVITVVLILAAWTWVYRDATRRRARPAAATLWMMGAASLALVTALAWPRLEPNLISLLATT